MVHVELKNVDATAIRASPNCAQVLITQVGYTRLAMSSPGMTRETLGCLKLNLRRFDMAGLVPIMKALLAMRREF